MNSQPPNQEAHAISEDALRAAVGDVADSKVIGILKLQPTLAELEEAKVWASGDGDVLAKGGRPLSTKVAEIVDILTAEDDEVPE